MSTIINLSLVVLLIYSAIRITLNVNWNKECQDLRNLFKRN